MKKFIPIILALVFTFAMSSTAFAAAGSTEVSLTVDSSQISVTVPTTLSITAKVDGGDATAPTDGTYKITNSSAIPVKVDTIAVAFREGFDSSWVFSSAPLSEKAPQVDSKNAIYLKVNDQVLAAENPLTLIDSTDWNINASNELPLPLVCSTSRLNTTDTVENLITITYTISAGTNA